MGHYTIRTNRDEDNAIRKAHEHIGAASARKAFMTAFTEYQHNRDEILRLRLALTASVRQFRASMNAMFDLADE